jgi:hypothetical protein
MVILKTRPKVTDPLALKTIRRLEEIKDVCKGQTAFILGNGPSLVNAPFAYLADVPTFGMNMIALIRDHIDVDWWPKYYTVVSSAPSYSEWHHSIQQAVRGAKLSFVSHLSSNMSVFNNLDFLRVIVTHHEHYETEEAEDNWWSDDIATGGVCKFGSSSLAVFQIAAYMGFKNIYLLGFDLGYRHYKKGEDPNHFDYGYNPDPHSPEFYEAINAVQTRAHEIASVNLKRLGVRVLNATKGSAIDVWPRVSVGEMLAFENIKSNITGQIVMDCHDASVLSKYVAKCTGDYLEIGTLYGGSMVVAGLVKDFLGLGGKLYAVDPMDGYYGDLDTDLNIFPTDSHFWDNMDRFGFADRVELIKSSSIPWPVPPDVKPEITFIDGDHSYEFVKSDLENAARITSRYILVHDSDQDDIAEAVNDARIPMWYVLEAHDRMIVLERREVQYYYEEE